VPAADLEEFRKDYMQSAAARAKQRRQQEEDERAKAQERARKKAAEIEAKMKAEAEEKARLKEATEQPEVSLLWTLFWILLTNGTSLAKVIAPSTRLSKPHPPKHRHKQWIRV
jgi:sRNA-binding protein